jgi:rare lipoprotein A
MHPVAKHPRAGFRLATPCRVLSRILVMAGCISATCAMAAEAADAQSPAETVFQASLKSGSPRQVFGGAFRYDGPDDNADETPAVLEAPRFREGRLCPGAGRGPRQQRQLLPPEGRGQLVRQALPRASKTSSGDSFDMYAMTAAHPSLPIPSYVRVTNLANGRSAVVRINDRGPFHPGRIIDLSYAAAYKLGYADNGHANVEVALMLPEGVAMVQPNRRVPPIRHRGPAPSVQLAAAPARPAAPTLAAVAAPQPPAPAEAPRVVEAPAVVQATPAPAAPVPLAVAAPARAGEPVFLQLGAFANAVNAEHFKGFVEHELKWLKSSVSVLAAEGKYRLQLGPFPSAPEARAIAERIATTLKLRPELKGRD